MDFVTEARQALAGKTGDEIDAWLAETQRGLNLQKRQPQWYHRWAIGIGVAVFVLLGLLAIRLSMTGNHGSALLLFAVGWICLVGFAAFWSSANRDNPRVTTKTEVAIATAPDGWYLLRSRYDRPWEQHGPTSWNAQGPYCDACGAPLVTVPKPTSRKERHDPATGKRLPDRYDAFLRCSRCKRAYSSWHADVYSDAVKGVGAVCDVFPTRGIIDARGERQQCRETIGASKPIPAVVVEKKQPATNTNRRLEYIEASIALKSNCDVPLFLWPIACLFGLAVGASRLVRR